MLKKIPLALNFLIIFFSFVSISKAELLKPNSEIKPLEVVKIQLLGLQKNLINENTEVFCKGHSTLKDRNYYCWKKGGHGKVNLKKAIKESCDVYFYELAKKTNIDDLSSSSGSFSFPITFS